MKKIFFFVSLLFSPAVGATTYLYNGEGIPPYVAYGIRWSGPTMDSYLQGQVPLPIPAPFERLSSLGIEYRSFGNLYLDPTFYDQLSLDPMYELVHAPWVMLRAYVGPVITKSADASFGVTPHAGLVSSMHLWAGLWFDPALEFWTDTTYYDVSLAVLLRYDIKSLFVRAGTKAAYFSGPSWIGSNNTAYGLTGNFWVGYFF